MKTDRSFITFHTTYSALKAERLLRSGKISISIVSVPRHISSDCGIGIQFDKTDRANVECLLTKGNVEIAGIYDE